MKNIVCFFLSFCLITVITCCDNNENKIGSENPSKDTALVIPEKPLDLKDHIVGEWVVDSAMDDFKGVRWEILKFLESGMMYFSNYSEKSENSHVYVNGTYNIEGNVIKTNCELGWTELYTTYNADLHVSQVDEYTLKADIKVGGQVIGTNTYSKVVYKIELESGDFQPDYAKIVGGKTIKGFKSHNNYIATVDKETGKINSEWSGSTYVDVITDKGTAAVQVTIKSILYFDYEDYVGATMKDVVKVFARQNSTDKNVLVYKYNENYYPSLQQKSGNWNSMYIRLNSISGFVDNISLVAKDDVWFTEYQISDYLSERYTMYKRTTKYDPIIGISEAELDKIKDFYIGKSLEEAKVGVTWNTDSKILSFVDLKDDHRKTVDYGHFIGMTSEEVKIIMGEPAYSKTDEWIAYHIGGLYTNMLKFSFKNRYTNKIKETIQEIVVYLYDDIDVNTFVSVFDEKYLFENEAADSRIYSFSNPRLQISIWLGNQTRTKLIQYVWDSIDLENDGLWPNYAAVVRHNVDEVKAAMGEPVDTHTDQIAFQSYKFGGVFWFYDITGNDYIKRIAVNRNLRWSNATNIIVFLQDDINHSDITSYLGNLYHYQESDSDASKGVFVYKTTINYVDIWIEYDSVNGAICYFRK